MDFLIRHYEKLILVVCLLLLLYSLKFVSASQTASATKTADTIAKLKNIVKGDTLIDEMSAEDFESLDKMLSSPLTQVNLMGSPNGPMQPALLEGGQFVICNNKECGYILPFHADTCPWCHTNQKDIGPDLPADNDLDQDGIPDLFEKATTFLHYRFRYDGMGDFDQDGFLNVEEYRAGTALDDPESRPPLAYLLRVAKASKDFLPVTLVRIKQNGSAAPSDWKASFRVEGDARPQDVKLNGAIPKMAGFTLKEIANDLQSVTISNGTTSYAMEVGGEKIAAPDYSVTLRFMANHIFGSPVKNTTVEGLLKDVQPSEIDPKELRKRQYQLRMMNGGMAAGGMRTGDGTMNNGFEPQLVFDINVGETFALRKLVQKGTVNGRGMDMGMGMNAGMGAMGGATGQNGYEEPEYKVEYYQLLEVLPGEGADAPAVVRVQQLASELGQPVGNPITLTHLDKVTYQQMMMSGPDDPPNHDFLAPNNGIGGNASGMGGMTGMPGAF
ncbi:MAG: hypothetical protein MJ202_00690 [Lentisphaeria bacterium]|nr:hypothetical protein [Lentisphaeria bacterium]